MCDGDVGLARRETACPIRAAVIGQANRVPERFEVRTEFSRYQVLGALIELFTPDRPEAAVVGSREGRPEFDRASLPRPGAPDPRSRPSGPSMRTYTPGSLPAVVPVHERDAVLGADELWMADAGRLGRDRERTRDAAQRRIEEQR